jgi:hypothetical protein
MVNSGNRKILKVQNLMQKKIIQIFCNKKEILNNSHEDTNLKKMVNRLQRYIRFKAIIRTQI